MQRSSVFLVRILCLTLIAPSSWSQSGAATSAHKERAPHADRSAQGLPDEERILHALNRFTFGPRPGDVEQVRQIGLDEWFERQLHPASMEYGELDRRLSEAPAMRLQTPQLLAAFPSGAILRQAADGKLPVPKTPILRTIYSDQIAFYKEREARKSEKEAVDSPGPAAGKNDMQAAMGSSGGSMSATMESSQASHAMAPNAKTPESDAGKAKAAEAEVLTILALAPEQRMRRMLAMNAAQLEDFRAALKGSQRAQLLDKMTAGQREIVADLENPSKAVVDEMMEQRLIRDVYSPAQLQEVMTDFWLNHFNVYLHKNEETPYYLVSFERDVIRPRALGKFEDLLVATAESPAMLLYLDNSSSMGPDSIAGEKEKQQAARQNKPAPVSGLNENYARELMELHTLGVNGGYTQEDVTEMARVLTGWTVSQPARGGGFLFDERKHEPGTKKLLGMNVKEDGQNEGLRMLHVLAMQPATARFLSRKLALRFVSDDPPQSLVDRMAKSYLASDGDITRVLRTLFHSPEFWQRGVYRSKVKTPLEYVVSAVRASNAKTESMMPLAHAAERMGMPLYGCVPPTGYSAKAEAWVSTGALVERMNFALALAANKLPGIQLGWSGRAEIGDLGDEVANDAAPMDMADDERRLESRLVAGGVSEQTRDAVMEQAVPSPAAQTGNAAKAGMPALPVKASAQIPGRQKPPGTAATQAEREKEEAVMAGLLLGSPEFQRK
jgi:uncharacterized protein (DUF1800 family)